MEDDLDEIAGGAPGARSRGCTSFWFGNGDAGRARASMDEGASSEADAAAINSIPLGVDDDGEPIVVRNGRYGPVPASGARTPRRCPTTSPPDELTIDRAVELLAGAEGRRRRSATIPRPACRCTPRAAASVPTCSSATPTRCPTAEAEDGVAVPDDGARDDHARRRAAAAVAARGSSAPTRTTASEITAQNGRYGPVRQEGRRTAAASRPRSSCSRSRSTRRCAVLRRAEDVRPRPGGAGAAAARSSATTPCREQADRGEGRPVRSLRHRRRDERVAAQGRHGREHHASSGRPSCCRSGATPGPAKKARKGAKKAPAKKAGQEGGGQEEGAGEEGAPRRPRRRRTPDRRASRQPVDLVTWTRWRNSARCRCPGSSGLAADAPTEPTRRASGPGDKPGLARAAVRRRRSSSASGSRRSCRRIGDWLGFLAITAARRRASAASSPAAAVGLVMSARIVPGLLPRPGRRRARRPLRPQEGDGRAATSAGPRCWSRLPFVDTVLGARRRVAPARDASRCCGRRPRRRRSRTSCPPDHLTTANSLSLVAAYGTFPIAGARLRAARRGRTGARRASTRSTCLRTDQEARRVLRRRR